MLIQLDLPRQLQVIIENIYFFEIIKDMKTSIKTGFAQMSLAAPKNLSCPKIGGGGVGVAAPLVGTPMTMLLYGSKGLASH